MFPPVTEIATGRPAQLVLELSAPPATAETPLVPVRMVNEFVYCPRLAFLEWVDGEWADSGDTEEGRRAHVRVDSGGGKLPAPEAIDDKPDFAARSVTLASSSARNMSALLSNWEYTTPFEKPASSAIASTVALA